MNGMISVIVPVYNVEPYLAQAVDSILSQDYEDLEVLLIDDGSRDASGDICDEYAARDQRVKVIHQKNGGAAAAKNAGLRAAAGEYLSFVDSDDYLEPGSYRYMAELLESTGADVVQCAFRNVYRSRKEDFVLHPGRTEVDAKSYLKRFPSDWTCALLWNKLYRRTLYQDIFFEEGHRIDDEYFTYKGILNAKTVIVDDRIVYNYRRRGSSAMNAEKAREQRMFDRVDFMRKRRDEIVRRCPELKWDFDFQVMDALVYLSRDPDNTPATIALLKRELKSCLRNRDHSRPPRYLWKPMLKLLCTGTNRLLSQCPGREEEDLEDYFD